MIEVISILAVASIIIFVGFLSELIFRKTKIPDVLILMLIGIFIGSILNWVDVKQNIGYSVFTTFALVFIIFQGALSIDFYTLLRSLKGALKLTLIGFVITVGVIFAITHYGFGYDVMISLLIGIILGGTSSAVVIPMIKNLNANKQYGSILTLESALTDVLCIVGAITVMTIILGGQVQASSVFKSTITSFLMAAAIGIIFGLFWIIALAKSKMLAESYMVTVAAIVALYAFVESPYIEASGAISALSFGLLLGNSHSILHFFAGLSKEQDQQRKEGERPMLSESILSHSAKNFYSEISFFVKVFFFVYLGMVIDFSNPIIFAYGGIIALAVFIMRPVAVGISFIGDAVDKKSRTLMNVLVPKGLAAAVLAQIALQKGIVGAQTVIDIVFATIFISIIFTSFLIFINRKKLSFEEEVQVTNQSKVQGKQLSPTMARNSPF